MPAGRSNKSGGRISLGEWSQGGTDGRNQPRSRQPQVQPSHQQQTQGQQQANGIQQQGGGRYAQSAGPTRQDPNRDFFQRQQRPPPRNYNSGGQRYMAQQSLPPQGPRFSELELLMGADGPFYFSATKGGRGEDFFARFLVARNASPDHPNYHVLHESIWSRFCLYSLFNDPSVQKILSTIPSKEVIPSGDVFSYTSDNVLMAFGTDTFAPLTPQQSEKEQVHLRKLQSSLEDVIYNKDRLMQMPENRFWCFFSERKEQLQALVNRAEPYTSMESQFRFDLQGASDEGKRAAIRDKITLVSRLKEQESPAALHLAHWEKLTSHLLHQFGDYNKVLEDLKEAQVVQGRVGNATGETMEDFAFSSGEHAGLDRILRIVHDAEQQQQEQPPNHSQNSGGGVRSKYDLDKWSQLGTDTSGWWKHCQNLEFPSSIEPQQTLTHGDSEPMSMKERQRLFQDLCKKHKLPHLVLVKQMNYLEGATGKTVGELDGLIVDALDGSVLMLIEVKSKAADLIKARQQRDKLRKTLSDEFQQWLRYLSELQRHKESAKENDHNHQPPRAPFKTEFVSNKVHILESALPISPSPQVGAATTTNGPQQQQQQDHLPPPLSITLPQLTIQSFEGFIQDPVKRWIYLSSGTATNPVVSSFCYLAEREIPGVLAYPLTQFLEKREKDKSSGGRGGRFSSTSIGGRGTHQQAAPAATKLFAELAARSDSKEARDALLDEFLDSDNLRGNVLPIANLKAPIGAMSYEYKKKAGSGSSGGKVGLGSPLDLMNELRHHHCENRIVLVNPKAAGRDKGLEEK